MSKWEAWIMEQPENERVDAAIWALEGITGDWDTRVCTVMWRYGLTPKEARLVLALDAAQGRPMSREALYAALYDEETDVSMKIIDVMVAKIRKKGTVKIQTMWSLGYRLPHRLDVGGMGPEEIERCRG